MNSTLPQIERLKGRENYGSWKFAMQAFLQLGDLWDVVSGEESDEKTDKNALSKIILAVDPINYSHINNAKKAKEAWNNLEKAFEDSGLTRRVGLLRTLITTQLSNCKSVEDYVDKIITTAHKLNQIGFKVEDEWIGTLLLAGLPDEYKPMIMGIESSGIVITGDSIKIKLLQDVRVEDEAKSANNEAVLYSNKF